MAFNEEKVTKLSLKLKKRQSFSSVGMKTDTNYCLFVADMRAATPNCRRALSPCFDELINIEQMRLR